MEHGQLAYRTLYEELYASLIQIEENVNKKIQHHSKCIQGLEKRKADLTPKGQYVMLLCYILLSRLGERLKQGLVP
jgi:type VI protein secretion system component VasF